MQSRLNFDRFNVHTKNTSELAEEVQTTEQEIETAENTLADGNRFLKAYAYEYQQLTIYYAFAKRNQALALKYAEKYKLCAQEGPFEYGIACNWVGNANFMTGGDNNPSPFKEALAIFEKVENQINLNSPDDVLLKINQGFAHRYIGLAAHRQSMYSQDQEVSQQAHEEAVSHLNQGKKKFEEADEIQKKSLSTSYALDLDLMETVHLLGVRHTRRAEYQDAIETLLKAIEIENSFNNKTGAIHFLTYISMQSLGEAYVCIGENDKALEILSETLQGQEKLYKIREHIDIAKTLHFIGMARANKKDWLPAMLAFQEALQTKQKLLKPGDFMILATQIELLKTYHAEFDFDWNNELTIEKNEALIPCIEELIKGIDSSKLKTADAKIYAQLRYKLGTFYIHVNGDTKASLPHLSAAEKILQDEDLLWTQIHIGYCQQKNAYICNQQIKGGEAKQNEKASAIQFATDISDHIISEHKNKLSEANLNLVKIVAFAYAIKALTQYEAGQLKDAIVTYMKSEELYETYKLQYDGDQYARVENRLAMMFEESHLLNKAKKRYEFLVPYWKAKTEFREKNNLPDNRYQARFHDTYATFLENTGDLLGAFNEVEKAYKIRKKTLFTARNVEKLAKLKEIIQQAEQSTVTVFPGTLYGGNQPPRPASFPGTSVTAPPAPPITDSNEEAQKSLMAAK